MSEVCANLMCLRNAKCPACGCCDSHCLCEMLALEAQTRYHHEYTWTRPRPRRMNPGWILVAVLLAVVIGLFLVRVP